MRFASACAAVGLLFASAASGVTIAPLTTAAKDDDLKVSGAFAALSPGAVGYLPRETLLGLPGLARLHEAPAPAIPAGDLQVLPLDRLVDALPVTGNADALMLLSSDRWVSVVPIAFLRQVHPYLLLTYNGRTWAQGWPKYGPFEPLGPYYCGESAALGPVVPVRMEYGEFDASQVVEIRAVNLAEHYAPFYGPRLAALSPAAAAGRRIFIAECNNCHQGPEGVGGNTSQRPLALLEIHAALHPDFFRAFVRNPRIVYPNTVMPTHEYFTDTMMNQLIAFLSEARAAGVN